MFRRDHSATDSQFVLIEKNALSSQVTEEPLIDSALLSCSPSSWPNSKDPSLSILSSSPNANAPSPNVHNNNNITLKIKDKIAKNLRPVSYLNALTSSIASSAGAVVASATTNTLSLQPSLSFSPNLNSSSSFNSSIAPSTPNLRSSSQQHSYAAAATNSDYSSSSSSPYAPTKEILDLLATVDPTNERFNGTLFLKKNNIYIHPLKSY